MRNHIKVAVINSIITLLERGWPQRKIARELGINRKTVGRHITSGRAIAPKGANPTAGNLSPEAEGTRCNRLGIQGDSLVFPFF